MRYGYTAWYRPNAMTPMKLSAFGDTFENCEHHVLGAIQFADAGALGEVRHNGITLTRWIKVMEAQSGMGDVRMRPVTR